MKNYSVIVFDLGNVLLPFNYDPMIKYLNLVEPGLGEKFKLFYKENYHIHRIFEEGELSEDEFLQIMLQVIHHKIDSKTFCRIFSNIFTVNYDVIDILTILAEKYTTVLLSNTNSIHKKYGYEHFDFLNYFKYKVLSHDVHAIKPEEKIYRIVEQKTGRPPNEHIFIDDISDYVFAAKNCGWDGIQFTSVEDLKKNLSIRKII